VFGSCWGLQVIVAATGAACARIPVAARSVSAAGIRLTEPAAASDVCRQARRVNAPTVHLDESNTLPPGTTVLASNAVSAVQAAEIRTNGSVAWAVQYIRNNPLRELAAIVRRIGTRLIGKASSPTRPT